MLYVLLAFGLVAGAAGYFLFIDHLKQKQEEQAAWDARVGRKVTRDVPPAA